LIQKRVVGGVVMTEFAMSQAFHEYGREHRFGRLSVVGHEIDRLRNSHTKYAVEGLTFGWSSCVAIVNGRPVECHRVGPYTILVEPLDKASFVKLSRWQRYGLWLARVLRLLKKVY